MAETNWRPALVEEQLREAAHVLKRLPEQRVPGYFNLWPRINFNLWPRINPEFGDLVGRGPEPLKPLRPSPQAISRMKEVLN